MAVAAIRIQDLVHRFGEVTAIDHLSLEISRGEFFGVLGPNGAGKTTLIKILSTLLRPTSGSAEVAGFSTVKRPDEVRRRIGVVFQEPSLDVRMTAQENLWLHATVYGVPREERRERIAAVLAVVELGSRANSLVETFSGGMKRRLELARGFIHRPALLFLDEPSLGLDTQARRRMWEYLEELNRLSATTVILTTHSMEEADRMCHRVAIVDRGRIVALDAPDRLKALLGGDVVTLESDGDIGPLADELRRKPWVKSLSERDSVVDLATEGGARRIPEIVAVASTLEVPLNAVNLRTPSLEDVFLHFTGRSMSDDGPDDLELRFPLRGMGLR